MHTNAQNPGPAASSSLPPTPDPLPPPTATPFWTEHVAWLQSYNPGMARLAFQTLEELHQTIVLPIDDPLRQRLGRLYCRLMWLQYLLMLRIRELVVQNTEASWQRTSRPSRRCVAAVHAACSTLQTIVKLANHDRPGARSLRMARAFPLAFPPHRPVYPKSPAAESDNAAGIPFVPQKIREWGSQRPAPCGLTALLAQRMLADVASVPQKEGGRLCQAGHLIATRAADFVRQGSIVATTRPYQGRLLGPYYRLVWRESGRQRKLYLGSAAVAAIVQSWLDLLQGRVQHDAHLDAVYRQAEADIRREKAEIHQLLAQSGRRLKGYEVRPATSPPPADVSPQNGAA